MNDPLALMLVASICIAIGAILGSLTFGARKNKPLEEDDSKDEEFIEMVRIGRDQRSNKLIARLDGKSYLTARQLTASQHERLVQAVMELRSWLLQPNLAAPGMGDAAQATETKVEVRPVPAIEKTPSRPVSDEMSKRPSLNPIDVISRAIQSDVGKPTQETKSIAAQVDEILQEKLENSPLQDRAIRLMELPGKGMVVLVGLNQYDGVGSVPDPEIRDLLRECVAEWEKRVSD
jgi:hypothetical protein